MKVTAIGAAVALFFAASAMAQETTPAQPAIPPAPVPASSCGEFPAAPTPPTNVRGRARAAAQAQYDAWRALAQQNIDCRATEYRTLQAHTNARAHEYEAAVAAGQAAGAAWQAAVGGGQQPSN